LADCDGGTCRANGDVLGMGGGDVCADRLPCRERGL
jgi:hypothetical protein